MLGRIPIIDPTFFVGSSTHDGSDVGAYAGIMKWQ